MQMHRKTLYIDTETTGTDPQSNGLIQLALIVEIDDEVLAEKSWHVRPFVPDVIEEEALRINRITEDKLRQFPGPRMVYQELLIFLGQYVDKFDRTDKFFPAGYKLDFDMGFLKRFFEKNGDSYFGSWFNGRNIDPLPWLHRLNWIGELSLPDYRLKTVCNHFGINLGDEAHDAMADIRATRELIKLLTKDT